MALETQILELLERWEALHQQGKTLAPEELCADCPEYLEEVKQRLHHLQAFDQFLGTGSFRREPSSDDDVVKTSSSSMHQTLDPVGPQRAPADEWPLVNGYEILEQLGQGGMGRVFKARQTHLDRVVALKIIRPDRLTNPDNVRRFQREARASARLAHPNIVTLYDAGQDEATHYLAMEYVEGTDLAHLVRERGPLPIAEACEYIRQAALGLQHAFERGLVHRDIKPSNLLRAADGKIKILDLGLARLVETGGPAESSSSALTEVGVLMGTADYMAPEQASDARKADIRADLYSLGCTLFFLLTARPPFPEGSFADKVVRHAVEEPLPLRRLRPEVPAGVCKIVQRLMAKKPENRYQTPAELAADLEPFSHSAQTAEAIVSPSAHPAPSSSLTSSAVALAGVVPRLAMRLQFGKAGCSFTLMSVLVLLAGAGVTALSISFLMKPASSPLNAQAGPAEADIESQIANKQFVPALNSIDAGTFEKDKKQELREHVLRAWLQEARTQLEKHDPKGALAQANEILKYSPGNPEASRIVEHVTFLKELERQKPPEELAREKLKRATDSLNSKPDVALNLFGDVARMQVSADLRDRANLGQARAQARLGNWDEVGRLLPQLPQGGMAPTDRALRTALQLKAELPGGVDSKTEEKKLVAMLDQLIPLQSREFWKNLEEQLEGTWTNDLAKQVVAALLAKITDIRDHVQQRPEDIDKALEWAAKLARYDAAAYKDLAVTTKEQAVQNLVAAAAKIPREELKNPLLPPWKDHGENLVFEWLSLAYRLAEDELSEGARKDLIVAAGARKDFEAARRVLQQTPLEKKRENIPCLLVKAKAQPLDPKGCRVAFETYADLLDLVLNQKDIPLRERKNLLESALASGERAVDAGNADLKRRLAECYLTKAELIHKSLDLWPDDWRRERVVCYEKATHYWRDPNLLLDLSRIHQEWALQLTAKGEIQRKTFAQALADADQALPNHPNPDRVYYRKAKILEDMASVLGEKERYKDAIVAYSQAITKGGETPVYLLDRGRAYYHRAVSESSRPLMDDARKDLAKAVQKKGLSDKEQAEALFMLGTAYWKQTNPDRARAEQQYAACLQWMDTKNVLLDRYEEVLKSLANLGEGALDPKVPKSLDYPLAADCFEVLGRHAQQIKSEQYEFWAANRMRLVGEYYERQQDPKKALEVYERGLPKNLAEATPAHVRLLSVRNAIFVKPAFKGQLKKPATLLADAERAVKLALTKHRWISPTDIAEAHVAAALCDMDAGQQNKALDHLDQALALRAKLDAKSVKQIEALRKQLKP